MSIFRGRLYTVEEIQELLLLKKYEEEMGIFRCVYLDDENRVSSTDIADNIVAFADFVILKLVEAYSNDFIFESDFQLGYDRIVTYISNIDVLGNVKVFNKIIDEVVIDILYEQPFMAFIK